MEHLNCQIYYQWHKVLRGDDIYGKLGNYPKSMKSLTQEKREELGKNFIDDTRMHRKDAPRFTDKMPNNFRHIGLSI